MSKVPDNLDMTPFRYLVPKLNMAIDITVKFNNKFTCSRKFGIFNIEEYVYNDRKAISICAMYNVERKYINILEVPHNLSKDELKGLLMDVFSWVSSDEQLEKINFPTDNLYISIYKVDGRRQLIVGSCDIDLEPSIPKLTLTEY